MIVIVAVVIVIVIVVVIVVVIVIVIVVIVVVVGVIVIVGRMWLPSASWTWPSSMSRSIGLPIAVDERDVMDQPVERLRLADLRRQARARRRSARTARRTSLAFSPYCIAIRAYSASRSRPSTTSSSASATARSARSILTASTDRPRIDSMNSVGSCPVAVSHCPRSMPWAWNCWVMSWSRWLRSLWTIASGGSTSTSAPTAAVTALVSSWRDWLSFCSPATRGARRPTPRPCRTRRDAR